MRFTVRDDSLQIVDVRLGNLERLEKLYAVRETGKDGEFALERTPTEEKVESCYIVVLAGLPVGIRHRDLVEVGQQRLHNGIEAAAIRSVHLNLLPFFWEHGGTNLKH